MAIINLISVIQEPHHRMRERKFKIQSWQFNDNYKFINEKHLRLNLLIFEVMKINKNEQNTLI